MDGCIACSLPFPDNSRPLLLLYMPPHVHCELTTSTLGLNHLQVCSILSDLKLRDGQNVRTVRRPGGFLLCIGAGGLEPRIGHLLRRPRRRRDNGRRVWVRQPVRGGVRSEQRGAEHVPLRRRRVVRAVLPDRLRRLQDHVLQAGRRPGHRHGHQPLPAQLGPLQQQRRLVQPAARPLRHVAAGLAQHRPLQGRHHPGPLPAGQVLEAGRHEVHHRRLQQLRARAHLQRRRPGLHPLRVRQGGQDRLDPAEPQLGSKLAVQRRARRTAALLRRHLHQRPEALHQQPSALLVEVRHDVHKQPAVHLLVAN